MVNTSMKERGAFLAALAALGVTLFVAEKIVPKSGLIIAGGVLLWWVMTSDAVTYLVGKGNDLIGGLSPE